MERVARPSKGASYRITRRGYIDGVFIIDGRRVFKGLGRFEDVDTGPSGRRRTEIQVNALVQQMWDAKRLELEAATTRKARGEQTMADLFEAWMQNAQAKGRAAGTLEIHGLMRDYYLEAVGNHPIQEQVGDPPRMAYDLHRADRYLAALKERGLGSARINSYLGRLSSALRFAYGRGLLERVPVIERLKAEKRPPKVPSTEHIARLARHLDSLVATTKNRTNRYYYGLHRLLFYLLLGTGMRRAEAFHLRRSQVDLANRSILLLKTKTGEARVCRIPQFLRESLQEHFDACPGQTWLFEHPRHKGRQAWQDPSAMTTAFKRHLRALGMGGQFKVLHGYRALFSTAGLNNVGVDPVTMKNQLGHADLNTTVNYYLAGMQDAQLRAVDAMEEAFFKPLLAQRDQIAEEEEKPHSD